MKILDVFKQALQEPAGKIAVWGDLPGASASLAISSVIAQNQRPILIIAPDSLQASRLVDELHFFSDGTETLLHFPDWETLPYDHFSPHQDILSERLTTLSQAPFLKRGAIVTTISTIMHRLPPRDYLDKFSFLLKVADQINIEDLRAKFVRAGYHAVGQVREHGEFAVRGSIVDIFPMGSHHPFRIDLFDDEVDSIQTFSPDTQRSLEKIEKIHLLPAKEFSTSDEAIELFRQHWREQFSGNPLKSPIYHDMSEGIPSPGIEYYLALFFQQTATIFDYLPENTLIVTLGDIQAKEMEFWQEVMMRFEQGRFDITRPLLAPDIVFTPVESFNQQLKMYPRIMIDYPGKKTDVHFPITSAPHLEIQSKSNEPLAALQTWIQNYSGRVLFCVESSGRREVLLQLFKSISMSPTFYHSWAEFLTHDTQYNIIVAPIEDGFVISDPELAVLTESHLYGKRVMQRRLRKGVAQDPDMIIRDLTELQLDDPVVHIDHGVGRYQGLQTLTVGNQLAEFLCLEYQGGDKLYVPVSSLHLVSRYSGSDQEHSPINKLGNEQWQRSKRKAAEKARDVAAELLDLYAKRAAKPGHAYQLPEDQYMAFAAGFPFEETPDQLQAIEKVFADMASDKPMDRVVCGDVGFGKTEVAIRAAFMAVMNGKQVAILVPTTLLAQQHFQNFQDRFADWPVQVEVLSRFKTTKQQKAVLDRMAEGKVDIVVGTHKLLQDDIKFKELGLIIVDEEHRFGVKQKEILKALRSSVDILTLTATPIPRTLNMTLAGIRDMSIIATPPAKRLSVKTFVHEYQNAVIKEAIQREVMRGGQVYFLHNDVSTINKKAEDITALVPEARPAVAHGQMHERELERVMSEFYHRHYNVLICSTIIESGIDIPTANTIIINRADKFGLAQLHQLRGRVGRSHHQAYSYLLTPDRKSMTGDAIKRLDAITHLDQLGIGFTLSTHDLEIRGAGELLGEEQSGNMQEVGFSLYMDLLTRAVDALKEGKEPDLEKSLLKQRSEIDLHITALIPENYLDDVQLRLQFYKRIASAKNQQALDEIQVEMIDRFGLLPQPLKNLFALAELKNKADELGIEKIDANENGGRFEFAEKPNVSPETIIRLIQAQTFKLEGPTCLKFSLNKHDINERISLVSALLGLLS